MRINKQEFSLEIEELNNQFSAVIQQKIPNPIKIGGLSFVPKSEDRAAAAVAMNRASDAKSVAR